MKKILIVDDNPAVRILTANFLRAKGFSVNESTNGQEALRLFLEDQPDVVISDREMETPSSGLELAKEVKARKPDAMVIMMSGFWDSNSIEEAAKLDIEAILHKPFGLSKLLSVLPKPTD